MNGALARVLGSFQAPLVHTAEPFSTQRAAREVSAKLSGTDQAIPDAVTLDAIHAELTAHWSAHGELKNASRRVRKWLPYVLFYPPHDDERWIARKAGFREALGEAIRQSPTGRLSATVALAVLRAYPSDADLRNVWLSLCKATTATNQSPRCRVFRAAQARFALFDPQGPRTVASHWLVADFDMNGFREHERLPFFRPDFGFTAAAAREMLNSLQAELTNNASADPEHITRKLQLAYTADGSRLLTDITGDFLNCLLLPFTARTPSESLKTTLRRTILERVGDPRLAPTTWRAADQRVRDLMMRWLVEATIEQFFELLDETALQRHWQDRRAFWQAYLDRGSITSAWIVLGKSAVRKVKQMESGPSRDSFGRLHGAAANQSVLLLQLAGRTIVAEWSHEGACRVWDDPLDGPRPYKSSYQATDIRSNRGCKSFTHDVHGYWRRDLAREITRLTGIPRIQK